MCCSRRPGPSFLRRSSSTENNVATLHQVREPGERLNIFAHFVHFLRSLGLVAEVYSLAAFLVNPQGKVSLDASQKAGASLLTDLRALSLRVVLLTQFTCL